MRDDGADDAIGGLWFGDSHVAVLVAQASSADRLSVMRHIVRPGGGPPRHVHRDEDEVFHILEGAMRVELAGVVRTASAGDTLLLPAGVPHGFRSLAPAGVCFLTVTRGRFEPMVRALSRPAEHPGPPPPAAMTPDDQARFAAVCAAHGIDLLGPPID